MRIKTFVEFIKDYNIEIPIIQRDYVYGREKSRETGKALVKAMIHSIQNCKVLDLNFIYGIETKSENEKAYYFPIDGQQRLTTLFLLYWYISIKSGHQEEFFQLNPDFSYKTRSSAREFFLWISDSNNTELFDLIEEGKKKIDEGMRDMSGFKASWNADNTVQSCIYILSEIDNLLKRDNKLEEYYQNFEDSEKCSLKFTVINENSTAIADSKDSMNEVKAKANKTYIRMNARGKELTAFEKIKSIVDSLESEEKANSEKFSYKYDTEYINKMYENVSQNTNYSLAYITNQIDEKSRKFFINMFQILYKSNGKVFEAYRNANSSDEYIKELKQLYCDREAAEKYIDFMNYYMEFLLNNGEHTSETFLYLGMGNRFDDIFSEVLYIHYFAKKHNKILSKEDIETFHLVLKNLKYQEWNNKYKIVKDFIEEMSEEDSLIQYFNNKNQCHESVANCGLDDINTRWKEQVLLAKCCINFENNFTAMQDGKPNYSNFKDYKKFEEYRIKDNKLQFVMYAAGIWEKESPDSSEFEIFIDCLEQYSKYRNDELLWRQNYAIAAYTEIDNDSIILQDNDSINSISMKDGHIWNDSRYTWNDKDENEKTYILLLEIAKRTYTVGMENFSKLKEFLISKDSETESIQTWLGYALLWSDKLKNQLSYSYMDHKAKLIRSLELFTCRLTNEQDTLGSILFERSKAEKKPFMMHIFKISHLQNAENEFWYGNGIEMWNRNILSKTYAVHLEYAPYNNYIKNGDYNFRTCNIEIDVYEIIEKEKFINLPSNDELCLCYKNGKHHWVYEYQQDTPNIFKKYEYNMQSYNENCYENREKWKVFELTVDDLLREYPSCRGWSSEAIIREKLDENNTCELWKNTSFIKDTSSYKHNISYDEDIRLTNDKIDVEII